jgi:hypothetical protein
MQAAGAAATAQELLLISGDVDAQGVHLRPVKAMLGTPRVSDAGPYLLRITTSAGAVVEQRFASREVDHDSDRQRFGLAIANPGQIERIEILRDGRVVHQRAARERAQALGAAGEAAAAPQLSESAGVLNVRWDASRHPFLTDTHVAGARTVIGLDLQGGAATVPTAALPPGGHFELGLSDGLNTQRAVAAR